MNNNYLFIFLMGMLALFSSYIDPGQGSFIWQMLIGGFMGSFFYFRKQIQGFFLRIFQKKKASDSE